MQRATERSRLIEKKKGDRDEAQAYIDEVPIPARGVQEPVVHSSARQVEKVSVALAGEGIRAAAYTHGALSELVLNRAHHDKVLQYISCVGGGAITGSSYINAAVTGNDVYLWRTRMVRNAGYLCSSFDPYYGCCDVLVLIAVSAMFLLLSLLSLGSAIFPLGALVSLISSNLVKQYGETGELWTAFIIFCVGIILFFVHSVTPASKTFKPAVRVIALLAFGLAAILAFARLDATLGATPAYEIILSPPPPPHENGTHNFTLHGGADLHASRNQPSLLAVELRNGSNHTSAPPPPPTPSPPEWIIIDIHWDGPARYDLYVFYGLVAVYVLRLFTSGPFVPALPFLLFAWLTGMVVAWRNADPSGMWRVPHMLLLLFPYTKDAWLGCLVASAFLLLINIRMLHQRFFHYFYRWRLQKAFFERAGPCSCAGIVPGCFEPCAPCPVLKKCGAKQTTFVDNANALGVPTLLHQLTVNGWRWNTADEDSRMVYSIGGLPQGSEGDGEPEARVYHPNFPQHGRVVGEHNRVGAFSLMQGNTVNMPLADAMAYGSELFGKRSGEAQKQRGWDVFQAAMGVSAGGWVNVSRSRCATAVAMGCHITSAVFIGLAGAGILPEFFIIFPFAIYALLLTLSFCGAPFPFRRIAVESTVMRSTLLALGATHSGPHLPPWAFLSDGGQVETLGLLPLLHRRLPTIFVVDASEDPLEQCAALRHSLDLAVETLNIGLYGGTPTERVDFNAAFDSYRRERDQAAFTFCVQYADQSFATVHYVKPRAEVAAAVLHNDDIASLHGGCCECCHDKEWRCLAVCCGYFPHHSSRNQFFTSKMFDQYSKLGQTAMTAALNPRNESTRTFAAPEPFPRRQYHLMRATYLASLCFAVFSVLFALRMDHVIETQWSLVVFPLELAFLALSLHTFVRMVPEARYTQQIALGAFSFLFMLQALAIGLRVDDVLNWDWTVIFVPFHLCVVAAIMVIIGLAMITLRGSKDGDEQERSWKERMMIVMFVVAIIVFLVVPFCLGEIFVALKLDANKDVDHWTWLLVLLPADVFFLTTTIAAFAWAWLHLRRSSGDADYDEVTLMTRNSCALFFPVLAVYVLALPAVLALLTAYLDGKLWVDTPFAFTLGIMAPIWILDVCLLCCMPWCCAGVRDKEMCPV